MKQIKYKRGREENVLITDEFYFVAVISIMALKRIKGYYFWKSSFPYKTTISKKIPCLNIQKKI